MISSLPLLLLATLTPLVRADAFEDIYSKYQQQTEAKKYESTVTRRERNLDHWDVPTAAAYLGLHPETLKPLPRHASDSSLNGAAGSVDSSTSHLTDEYVGHDAAILFYAQWCRNCHAVAPQWDAIATHANAGSRSSNLVMALFDCEKDTRNMELCVAAGVASYPTLMYVGSGEYHDTDFVTRSILGRDKSAGPSGATNLKRTVKFQGNWQYGDQLLDWITIMKGLSSWHSMNESGPLRGLRNGLFRFITGGKYKGKKGSGLDGKGKQGSLAVGVPPNFQTELRGMGSTSGSSAAAAANSGAADAAANDQKVEDLQLKLDATTKVKDQYEKAYTHSSILMDGLLLPEKDTASKRRDPFAILTESDGWYQNATSLPPTAQSNDEHPSILRSCALELTIDYCTRITTHQTGLFLEVLGAIPESDPFPTLEEIEAKLLSDVTEAEPYCGLIESCIVANNEPEGCRPATCPFRNEAACLYVESCLNPSIQDEYGVALGLIEEGEKVMDKDLSGGSLGSAAAAAAAAGDSTDASANAGVGGWGIPAN